MTPSFLSKMAEATRLTRTGKLQGAVDRIQAALAAGARTGGGLPVASNDEAIDVIDVEAREVRDDEPASALPQPSAQPQRTAPPDTSAQPQYPAHPQAGQFIAGSHTHAAAGTRDYKLYVPPGYRGQPLPLVVMLHGCKQDPDDFAAGTAMNHAAAEGDFLMLYPGQSQRVNPSRCWNWFEHGHQQRGRGEPALLAEMTREVAKRYNADPRRIYVAGLSAGGAMAAILGEAYPDLFAAVGVHSGLATGSASDVPSAFAAMRSGAGARESRTAAPPTIVFHGDEDRTVHPVNGEHVAAASAGEGDAEVERARSGGGREYTRQVYRDAGGDVVGEHWVVHGAGHAWSGGSAQGSYTDPKGPDATREMLRFFFGNALRAAS